MRNRLKKAVLFWKKEPKNFCFFAVGEVRDSDRFFRCPRSPDAEKSESFAEQTPAVALFA
jgi:hypothetical protein